MTYRIYKFISTCENCEEVEEFICCGENDTEYKCLRCGNKLENEIDN